MKTHTRTQRGCTLCGRSDGTFVVTSHTTQGWMEIPTRTTVTRHHEACYQLADQYAKEALARQNALYREASEARRAGAPEAEWEALLDRADDIRTGYFGPWPEP